MEISGRAYPDIDQPRQGLKIFDPRNHPRQRTSIVSLTFQNRKTLDESRPTDRFFSAHNDKLLSENGLLKGPGAAQPWAIHQVSEVLELDLPPHSYVF